MITPAATARDEYYKIGDNVEFAWNYTSLLVPPKQVNVLVSDKSNQATYTLANNVTFKPTGRVVWNTSQDEEGPNALRTEFYTLVIHDAAEDVTAPAEPGHLVTFQDFTFGMYIPRPYTPWPGTLYIFRLYANRSAVLSLIIDWKCATCSSALSDMERQTLKFVLGMCTITFLSFTWFAGGFGALF